MFQAPPKYLKWEYLWCFECLFLDSQFNCCNIRISKHSHWAPLQKIIFLLIWNSYLVEFYGLKVKKAFNGNLVGASKVDCRNKSVSSSLLIDVFVCLSSPFYVKYIQVSSWDSFYSLVFFATLSNPSFLIHSPLCLLYILIENNKLSTQTWKEQSVKGLFVLLLTI